MYEFDGVDWNEVVKLTPADGVASDQFGSSVAIDGNRVVVGAIGDDDTASSSGSAYVFEYDGTAWNEVAKLNASDATANDWFGSAVAISGDRIAIGAEQDDDNALSASGSVYLFDFDGVSSWNETGKLYASDPASIDYFGSSLAMEGDRMLVGARGEDPSGVSAAGSVYVFEHNGTNWVETYKIVAEDGLASDNFGISVAIENDRAVIGAHNNDDNGLSFFWYRLPIRV